MKRKLSAASLVLFLTIFLLSCSPKVPLPEPQEPASTGGAMMMTAGAKLYQFNSREEVLAYSSSGPTLLLALDGSSASTSAQNWVQSILGELAPDVSIFRLSPQDSLWSDLSIEEGGVLVFLTPNGGVQEIIAAGNRDAFDAAVKHYRNP